MSPAITDRSAVTERSGDCSNRVSAEPGIIASTPGRVRGSVRALTTASRKSTASPNRPPPEMKSITDSQRSSRPAASVVPRAGQATRTKRVMRNCLASSSAIKSLSALRSPS